MPQDGRAGSESERSDGRQRKGLGLKTYCKGLKLDMALASAAYAEWLAAPAGRKNAWRVSREFGSPEALLSEIVDEVSRRCVKFAPIATQAKWDDNAQKWRNISVESVKEQVACYIVLHAIDPLLKARVGYWQVGGVKGKGQIFGANMLRRKMRRGMPFAHGDFRHCFESIEAGPTVEYLARYVRAPWVVYLAREILANMGGHLVLGSPLSLGLALLVLSEAYHAVEGLAHFRRGRRISCVAFQAWYADDVFVFGTSAKGVRRAMSAIARTAARFGARLKPWKVCRVGTECADFAGIRCHEGATSIRKRLFRRMRRAFLRFRRKPWSLRLARRILSYWGWVRHTSNQKLLQLRGWARVERMAAATVRRYA